MTFIKPFEGYRYNEDKFEDIGKLMISSEEFETPSDIVDENSIFNMIKGIRYDADSGYYERATSIFSDWIKENVLVKEERPAIYLYEQKLEYNNVRYSTQGFVARLALSELSDERVMPCEKFEPKYNDLRAKFIDALGANMSMINCMYIEQERAITHFMEKVSQREPILDTETADGARQRLWAICDPSEIEFVQNVLKNHTLFLLDGKNRYEISLQYAKKRRSENPNHTGEEGYNYIMALLTNACDDSFMQAPFHRILKFPKGFKEDFFVSSAQEHFKIEKIIVDTQLGDLVDTIKKQIATTRNLNRFAVYAGQNYFYRLTLTDDQFFKNLMPDASDNYRSLDVTVLNKLILEDIFNIREDMYDERVSYTNSVTHGINEIAAGTHQCMVCMNAIKPEQIRSVVTDGEILPEKSVCVFPKPAFGVLINKFD